MAGSGLKTRANDTSVDAFIDGISDPARREECRAIRGIMTRVTACEPEMWGDAVVGFGRYHYVYDSGRSGDWFLCGFSPRAKQLTLYVMGALGDAEGTALLSVLGKHKTGKGCLYITRLSDVDLDVLTELIAHGVAQMKRRYG